MNKNIACQEEIARLKAELNKRSGPEHDAVRQIQNAVELDKEAAEQIRTQAEAEKRIKVSHIVQSKQKGLFSGCCGGTRCIACREGKI